MRPEDTGTVPWTEAATAVPVTHPDPAGQWGDRRWDCLATVPVPIRQTVLDGMTRLLVRHRLLGGAPLDVCFPMGQGGRTPFGGLRRIRRPDAYPAMVVSCEEGNLFNRRFYRDHGHAFALEQPGPVAEVFARAGLVDPLGQVGIFAVAPYVLLVDHRRLGGLPAPSGFADLLDPRYRGQVVLSGWQRPGNGGATGGRAARYNSFFLLAIHMLYGDEGIRALAQTVAGMIHSTQMPRLAGSNASVGGIYVAPWSLADMCPRRTRTAVVWPQEGAPAWPLWAVGKRDAAARLVPLTGYVFGTELGAILNRNRYPSLCPAVPPVMPAGVRLWWPGWDAVRDPATARRRRHAAALFFDHWRPATLPYGATACA